MASFVTLEREEYDDLIRDASQLAEMMTTLDLILDNMKKHAMWISKTAVFASTSELTEIANIIRYRMPEEWHELEKQVEAENKGWLNDEH
jgi:hypothetical protein